MREADDGGSGGEHQDRTGEASEPAVSDSEVDRPTVRTAFAAMLTEPLSKTPPAQRRYADQLMAAAVAAAGSGKAFERAEVTDPTAAETSPRQGEVEAAQEDSVSEAKAAAESPSTTSLRP